MPYSDMQLAEAFMQSGELADAREALDRHLQTQPEDVTARRLRAALLLRHDHAGAWQQALADLEAIPQKQPDDVIQQVAILRRLGDLPTALQSAQAGHASFPQHERLTETLLHLLREQGQIAQAREIVAGLDKDSWRWQQWAGDLAALAGVHEAALSHYSSALDLIRTRYSLDLSAPASVLANAAISDAANLTIVASVARLLLARAQITHQIGQLQAAAADYEQAARLIPGDDSIAFYLGLLAWQGGDHERARALCLPAWARARGPLKAELERALDEAEGLRDLLGSAAAE